MSPLGGGAQSAGRAGERPGQCDELDGVGDGNLEVLVVAVDDPVAGVRGVLVDEALEPVWMTVSTSANTVSPGVSSKALRMPWRSPTKAMWSGSGVVLLGLTLSAQ